MGTFKVGDILRDKYEITRVLGKGGMGEVLAAHHRTLDKLVALKFIHPSLQRDAESAARFIQEARAGGGIDNDHVARVYDVEMLGDAPFIVMEYLDGKDLGAILEERGKLEFVETANLLLQACEGIHEAHAMGIVHRDLKPSNLFVTKRRDGTPLVKVLDFGISKSTAPSGATATAGAAVFGSPRYMSPEQFASTRNVDARTDVWSLGVILYELLTGRPPFPGDALPEVYAAILRGTYTKPSRYRPDIPPTLEKLISNALVQDREGRLPSVEAFAAPLAAFATEIGLASFAHIRRSGSRASVSSERSGALGDAQPPLHAERRASASDETSPGRAVSTTDGSIVPPPSKTEPPLRRWPRYAALGVLAAAAASAIAVPRVRHSRATDADALIPPTVDPAPTSSASAGSDHAAVNDTKATGPTTADPAAVVATHAEETQPSTTSSGTGHATAEAPGTVAAPTPAAANACASGATAACEAACTAKRPGSCEKLADALFKGTGAPKDVARATTLYQATCDGGSAVACNDLGAHYALADGLSKDSLRALGLYRRACDMGLAKACVNLGAMHYLGSGVEKDYSLGVSYFLKGCEARDAEGCNNLSVAYATGHGVSPDNATPNLPRSFEFADRACNLGSGAGCVRAAEARVAGKGVDKDVKGGIAQLDTRCNKRDPMACESLAKLYTNGSGQDVPADPPRGRQYSEKACGFGSKSSCGTDGLRTNLDSARSDRARGRSIFQEGCDRGNAMDCGMLGELLLNGTAEDRAKAAALLRKGCDGGYDPACKKLGGGGAP